MQRGSSLGASFIECDDNDGEDVDDDDKESALRESCPHCPKDVNTTGSDESLRLVEMWLTLSSLDLISYLTSDPVDSVKDKYWYHQYTKAHH